jgi:NAD-dependent deacetylase
VVDAHEAVRKAASLIRCARYLTAFTGAGISVESGIPPFRGDGGLWERYDPRTLQLSYFRSHPRECWKLLRQLFYDHLRQAQPNEAHRALARWEAQGLLKAVITQNIDNLHSRAGSRKVVEFHGHTRTLSCLACGQTVGADSADLEHLPPRCACGGVLKPDLVFFGEDIPPRVWRETCCWSSAPPARSTRRPPFPSGRPSWGPGSSKSIRPPLRSPWA